MGLLSSVGRPPAAEAGGDHDPETRNAPAQGARGEERTRGPVDRTVLLRGPPGIRDLRSHASVRRPAVLGGTKARVHAGRGTLETSRGPAAHERTGPLAAPCRAHPELARGGGQGVLCQTVASSTVRL